MGVALKNFDFGLGFLKNSEWQPQNLKFLTMILLDSSENWMQYWFNTTEYVPPLPWCYSKYCVVGEVIFFYFEYVAYLNRIQTAF